MSQAPPISHRGSHDKARVDEDSFLRKSLCFTVQSTLGTMVALLVSLLLFGQLIAYYEGEEEIKKNREFQALVTVLETKLTEAELEQVIDFTGRDRVRGVEGFSSYEEDENDWNDLTVNSFLAATSYTFDLASTIGYGSFTAVTIPGRVVSLIAIIVLFPLAVVAYTRFSDLLFTIFAQLLVSTDRKYQEVLRKYDESNTGVLSAKELKLILQDLDVDLSIEDVDKVMNTFDINKDGNIDEWELRRLCVDLNLDVGLLKREYLQLEFAIAGFIVYNAIFALIFYYVTQGDSTTDISFFESVYFVIVTVSTVGLGDIVPAQEHRALFSALAFIGVGFTALLFKSIIEEIYSRTDLKKRYQRRALTPIFNKDGMSLAPVEEENPITLDVEESNDDTQESSADKPEGSEYIGGEPSV